MTLSLICSGYSSVVYSLDDPIALLLISLTDLIYLSVIYVEHLSVVCVSGIVVPRGRGAGWYLLIDVRRAA